MVEIKDFWKKDVICQEFQIDSSMQHVIGGREVVKIKMTLSEAFLAYVAQCKAALYQEVGCSRFAANSRILLDAMLEEHRFEFEFDGEAEYKIGQVQVSISFRGDSLILVDQFGAENRWEIDLDFGEDAFTGEPLDYLDGLIWRGGMDFVDATWKTSQKFKIDQGELERQYDDIQPDATATGDDTQVCDNETGEATTEAIELHEVFKRIGDQIVVNVDDAVNYMGCVEGKMYGLNTVSRLPYKYCVDGEWIRTEYVVPLETKTTDFSDCFCHVYDKNRKKIAVSPQSISLDDLTVMDGD